MARPSSSPVLLASLAAAVTLIALLLLPACGRTELDLAGSNEQMGAGGSAAGGSGAAGASGGFGGFGGTGAIPGIPNTPSPGAIPCGNSSCIAGAQVCCPLGASPATAGGGGGVPICVAPTAACTAVSLGCDERADCRQGICCATVAPTGITARCAGATACVGAGQFILPR
jgi:hypothetical protein